MNRAPSFAFLCSALLASVPLIAAAHCGPNERCVFAPCHHGPDAPECIAARGAQAVSASLDRPEVQEGMRVIVIPKVPQLELPTGGGATRSANAPAPPGKLERPTVSLLDPGPLPPGLPPSVIAGEVVPQVYAGTFAAVRAIADIKAKRGLMDRNPHLKNSQYLLEHHQFRLGAAFNQLEAYQKKTKQALDAPWSTAPSSDLTANLEQASRFLKLVIDTELPAAERR